MMVAARLLEPARRSAGAVPWCAGPVSPAGLRVLARYALCRSLVGWRTLGRRAAACLLVTTAAWTEPALAVSPLDAALLVGISADRPPFAFSRNGVLRGLEVDLAHELADALKRDHRLRQLPEGRLIDALRGGRIDLTFSELPPAELQALGLHGGVPVLATGQMAVIRSEDFGRFPRLLDLKLTSARVGYVRGTLGARLVHEKLVNAERIPVSSAEEGLAALRAGGIEVFIHDAATAWLLAADPQEDELSAIFRPLSQAQLRLVTRSEDQSLRLEIDRILDAWRRLGRLQRLLHRWIPVQIRLGERIRTQGLPPERRSSAQAAPSPASRRGTT